jgi:hypothetical protein
MPLGLKLSNIRNGSASEKVQALTFCDMRGGESTRLEDEAWNSRMSPTAVLPLPDFRPVDAPSLQTTWSGHP